MSIKRYKPTSPGRRFASVSDFTEITKKEPEKSLLAPMNYKAGRNNKGRITTRHKGGRNKRKYRIVDFRRDKDNMAAKVAAIEYDPNLASGFCLQDMLKELGSKRVCITKFVAAGAIGIGGLIAGALFRSERDTRSISEESQGIHEVHLVIVLHEFDGVATRSA